MNLGDYTPIKSTLIGALKSKLNINIAELAKDKVDYRLFYNCWYSHLLPTSIHFRRILCFENMTRLHPAQAVGDIFRCVIPLFDGNKGKMAMPIVSSGNQVQILYKAKYIWLTKK